MNAFRNQVSLIGNLGRMPEVKTFEGGRKMARLTLVTNEIYKNNNGEIVKNPNYEEIFKKRKKSEKTSKIIEKLNELDSKRIRAVCENQIKDSQTGETWLEYYNSQANELRNELQAIE